MYMMCTHTHTHTHTHTCIHTQILETQCTYMYKDTRLCMCIHAHMRNKRTAGATVPFQRDTGRLSAVGKTNLTQGMCRAVARGWVWVLVRQCGCRLEEYGIYVSMLVEHTLIYTRYYTGKLSDYTRPSALKHHLASWNQQRKSSRDNIRCCFGSRDTHDISPNKDHQLWVNTIWRREVSNENHDVMISVVDSNSLWHS